MKRNEIFEIWVLADNVIALEAISKRFPTAILARYTRTVDTGCGCDQCMVEVEAVGIIGTGLTKTQFTKWLRANQLGGYGRPMPK